MRKLLALIGVLLAAHVALLFVRPSGAAEAPDADALDIGVGVGFIFTDDLTSLAKEYPNVRFAGVDYAIATDPAGRPIPPPANLAALKFREEQGSFLVGALAALVGRSKEVGFVGGMDIPLIHKFEAGFRAGVKQVCPDCRVVAQ